MVRKGSIVGVNYINIPARRLKIKPKKILVGKYIY